MNNKQRKLDDKSETIPEDLIRAKAHEIWQARGGKNGNAEADWYAARQSITTEHLDSKTPDKIKISEKWIIGLTIFASVISIISIGTNIWQYFDRKNFAQLQRKSNLTAMIGAVNDSTTHFTLVNLDGDRILFRQKYECILTNNKYAPTTVVSWRVLAIEESPLGTGKLGGAWYAGMNSKLLNNDGKETKLPIRFEPGESKAVYIEVGMLVPRAAWQATKGVIPLDRSISYRKADSIFTSTGYPLFGQVKSVPIGTDSPAPRTYIHGKDYQEFLVYFVKGNGMQARAQFSLMGNPLYIQETDEEVRQFPPIGRSFE